LGSFDVTSVGDRKLKVFISYSRKDEDFAQDLLAGLQRSLAAAAVFFVCLIGVAGLGYSGSLDPKPGDRFQECASCPEMMVVPAGEFTMGSEVGGKDEKPSHKVMIAKPFAVGRFSVTFDEWDGCVAHGGCTYRPGDNSWGRGRQPVINVSWHDLKEYLTWLSKQTGKTYRRLTEAEWEYAARAGTTTRYSWGNEIGKNNANCHRCGSQWDDKQTAPVGSFKPNAFGLYDMHGNVWQWVEDCYKDDYEGAPTDGSAVASGNCSCGRRVVRGGSWLYNPVLLRSANRSWYSSDNRLNNLGIRVGRTLTVTS
jgi:formylglycine-generating enzyme required for sulfatase activity